MRMIRRLCPCWRKRWRLRSALSPDALHALLLQPLKMCGSVRVGALAMVHVLVIGHVASALVLVGAGVVALALGIALALALGGALAFALGDAVIGLLVDDRFARIVDVQSQWQYLIWRLVPIDRLDTDFTKSLSVRQVPWWRGLPSWNLVPLYHTLKQTTRTNRGSLRRSDRAVFWHVEFSDLSVREHELWARTQFWARTRRCRYN